MGKFPGGIGGGEIDVLIVGSRRIEVPVNERWGVVRCPDKDLDDRVIDAGRLAAGASPIDSDFFPCVGNRIGQIVDGVFEQIVEGPDIGHILAILLGVGGTAIGEGLIGKWWVVGDIDEYLS